MARVITFSRTFPAYHPKKGKPTYFVEKIVRSLHMSGIRPWDIANEIFNTEMYYIVDGKHHTIRTGNRWKAGDIFSPRVWSGKPYVSPMITIAPDIKIEKVWQFDTINDSVIINGFFYCNIKDEKRIDTLAQNDGLNVQDMLDWFKYPKPVTNHQIICWNKDINY
jgi:hypothetical protein